MWGCSGRALVRASRTNRSASPGDGVRPRSRTFTATSWPTSWSRTRNTAANPPSPSTSPTVNFLPRAFWRRRRSVVRSSDMADAKPRNLRRVALGTTGLVLVWLFGVWPPPVWWRNHWPRETAMMREQADCRSPSACPTVRPTDLQSISPVLQRMVIIAEDSRFRSHVGIDPAEVADALGVDGAHGFWSAIRAAWRHRDRLRGASTITQQLAKNLYLSSSRSPIRKLKEAATALGLELVLSKDRILELYLNVAEWGPGIWGIDGESRILRRPGFPPQRGAGSRAGRHAAASAHVEPHVPPGADARAPQSHSGAVSGGRCVHSSGGGNRLAANPPAGSCGPARARFAERRRTGGQ